MQAFQGVANWILRTIIDNYAGVIVGMIFTPFLMYLYRWMIGRTAEIKAIRWKFILGSSVLGGALVFCVAGSIATINSASTRGPDIRVSGVRMITGKGNATGTDTGITFIARLVNSGSEPSIVWNWKLMVTLPSGQTFESTASPSPAEVRMFDSPKDARKFVLSNAEYLPNELFEKPLQVGQAVQGWVWFGLRNMPPESFPIGAQAVVECEDSHGRRASFRWLWTAPIGRAGESP